MEKGNIFIWIIIGFLIAGGLLGAYYLGTKKAVLPSQLNSNTQPVSTTPQQVINSPTPSVLPDETSNWKTYINNKYKFSFKYPSNLKLTEGNKISLLYVGPLQKQGTEFHDGISLAISPIFKIDLLKEYVQQQHSNFDQKTGSVLKEISINNLTGYTFTVRTTGVVTYYYIKGQNLSIEIIDSTADSSGKGYKKIVDQILSTFKFTN